MLLAVALIAAAGLFECRRKSVPPDPDRLDSVCSITAKAVEDWFWWHGSLPRDFRSIRPYFLESPAEWRPESWWKTSFRIVEGTEEDPFYGGRLSRLEVIVRSGGKILARSVEVVDLRDPERLWKPHHTVLGPSERGLAKTEHNRACAVAEAVWDALQEKDRPTVSQRDVEGTSSGARLRSDGAFKGYEWYIVGNEIKVTAKEGLRRYNFPTAGPPSVNAKVGPAIKP